MGSYDHQKAGCRILDSRVLGFRITITLYELNAPIDSQKPGLTNVACLPLGSPKIPDILSYLFLGAPNPQGHSLPLAGLWQTRALPAAVKLSSFDGRRRGRMEGTTESLASGRQEGMSSCPAPACL